MIEKIREYLVNYVPILKEYENILADFLGEDARNYSIEPIPTEPKIKPYSDGGSLNQFVFQFSSREFYDNSVAQNIANLDFYDRFERQIEDNNYNGILPEIDGIQSIECLNNGTIQDIESGTAKYAIQMRITYIKEGK